MRIALTEFRGIRPRIDKVNLPEQAAQVALNCDLRNGSLQALKTHNAVVNPTKAVALNTIYRFGQTNPDESLYWFVWADDVNCIKAQIANDADERTIFTGDTTFGHPRVTKASIALIGGTDYPMASYRLGVPAPVSAPTLANGGGGSGATANRAYVYTYVTADGEEGQPSDPAEVVAAEGDVITVSGFSAAPAGHNITLVRIYRTLTATSTDYQFVAEITTATASFPDNLASDDLVGTLPSTDWEMPPAALKGIVNMPNGMVAGFVGNDVMFCEPYRPHAWPHREPMDFPVVGLGVFADTLVVATMGRPALISGVDPQQISVRKLDLDEGCVSKRSVAATRNGVCYASHNGIVMVGPQGASLITEEIISREFWQSLNPASIHAYGNDGRYIGFYNTGSATGGFIFDPSSAQPFVLTNVYATAGYDDAVRDALFVAIGDEIREWEGSTSDMTYTWRSKQFVLGREANFGWGQVIANAYPVTLRTYTDGALRTTKAVADARPFRLPSGFTARRWEIEIEGANRVTAVYLAQDSTELQAV